MYLLCGLIPSFIHRRLLQSSDIFVPGRQQQRTQMSLVAARQSHSDRIYCQRWQENLCCKS